MDDNPRVVVTKWWQSTAASEPQPREIKVWIDGNPAIRPHWITVVIMGAE